MLGLDNTFIESSSERVKQLSERKVGEIVNLSMRSIHRIDREHGREIAHVVEELGIEVTDMVNDIIRTCADKSRISSSLSLYLTTIVAANMALSVLSAVDEAMFEKQLEDYQKAGGAE